MRISFIHFPSHICLERVSQFILSAAVIELRSVFVSASRLNFSLPLCKMDKNKSIVIVGLILINSCSFALIVVLLLL